MLPKPAIPVSADDQPGKDPAEERVRQLANLIDLPEIAALTQKRELGRVQETFDALRTIRAAVPAPALQPGATGAGSAAITPEIVLRPVPRAEAPAVAPEIRVAEEAPEKARATSGPKLVKWIAWGAVSAGVVVIAAAAIQYGIEYFHQAPDPAATATGSGANPLRTEHSQIEHGQAVKVPVATAPQTVSINALGPDTSGYKQQVAPVASANGRPPRGKNTVAARDDFMDSYARVGAAVKSFSETNGPNALSNAERAQATREGCAMEWENGHPALMFSKDSAQGALSKSLSACEETIRRVRSKKKDEDVRREENAASLRLGTWARMKARWKDK